MDTKLKNNKIQKVIGVLVSLLLLSAVAAGAVVSYQLISENADYLIEKTKVQDETTYREREESYKNDFINFLYQSNYGLYLDIMTKGNNTGVSPGDIFLSESPGSTGQDNSISTENGEITYAEEENDIQKTEFIEAFNNLLNSWRNNFYDSAAGGFGLEYYIINHKTGGTLTNSLNPLDSLRNNPAEAQTIKDNYPFYAVFNYDEAGTVEIPVLYGLEESKKDDYKTLELTKDIIKNSMYNSDWFKYYNQIKGPSDITVIYAIKSEPFYRVTGISSDYDILYSWRQAWAFEYGGFLYAYVISLIAAVLLALILPVKKSWEIGKGLAGKVPLEIILLGISFTAASYRELLNMAMETASGSLLDYSDYELIPVWLKHILGYGLNYLAWMAVLLIWFIAVLSLRSVFSLGLKRYIKERTLTGIIMIWLIRNCKKIFASLSDIDLTEPSNKAILKILAVNFIILALLCSIWIAGVAVLIPYTILLFFILRKYFDDIKKKYGILLNATSNMAKGNLEVSVDEDLGIFNPLKVELAGVQLGFKKAVEEEMKSQKMKTELITNVSHDLKTPLTAIITYVNLLKEGSITEEERNSYIDTLDKKSLRLKRLIEDLFEISKASSNNIDLNLVEVDLVALIKQVQLELSDNIERSQVEFRYHLPEGKVILNLDCEKTYRIFENLILNITKYAMPHSRAYIDILTTETDVTVILKNTSATELDFNPAEISERFVRGDKSRNTEGSGLGLAIVKNFVELQGGKFQILLDGDLFKAVIEWKVPKAD